MRVKNTWGQMGTSLFYLVVIINQIVFMCKKTGSF